MPLFSYHFVVKLQVRAERAEIFEGMQLFSRHSAFKSQVRAKRAELLEKHPIVISLLCC